MTRIDLGGLWMLLVVSATLVACGENPPVDAKSPGYPPQPAPISGPQPGTYAQPTGPLAKPVFVDSLKAIETVEDAESALRDAEAELEGVGDTPSAELGDTRCLRSCKALGSMRRAVGRLCELTGDDDERCEDAKQRLDRSARKVVDAGCGC